MTNIQAHLVECNNCHARTVVPDGANVHDALNCRCCGDDHVHAQADGKTANPCRSVTINGNAVVVPAIGA